MEPEEVIAEIIQICKRMSANQVILFGSRAKGTNLERSDIDIAVSGVRHFEELREKIEEIPTLYMIDVLNLDKCKNEEILEDIRIYGRKVYEKVS